MENKTQADNYPHIQKALISGYKIHVDSTGSRLRVVYLFDNVDTHKIVYKSNQPSFGEAMSEIDNLLDGGTYGTTYWTGRYPEENDTVDTFVYQSGQFDIKYLQDKNAFEVVASNYNFERTPRGVVDKVLRTKQPLCWKRKGDVLVHVSSYLNHYDGAVQNSTLNPQERTGEMYPKRYVTATDKDLSSAILRAAKECSEEIEWYELDISIFKR
jgi:hypothetical protein